MELVGLVEQGYVVQLLEAACFMRGVALVVDIQREA
jgi:hypothetical protein